MRETWTGDKKDDQTGVGNDAGVELEINWKFVRVIPRTVIITVGGLPRRPIRILETWWLLYPVLFWHRNAS